MTRRLSIALAAALAGAAVFAAPRPASRPGVGFRASVSNFFARLDARLDAASFPCVACAGRAPFRSKRHDAFAAAKTKLAVVVTGAKAATG